MAGQDYYKCIGIGLRYIDAKQMWPTETNRCIIAGKEEFTSEVPAGQRYAKGGTNSWQGRDHDDIG